MDKPDSQTASRTTLAEIVQALARRLRDAKTPSGSGQGPVFEAWRSALKSDTESELLDGIALFGRTLNRLERQIDGLSMLGADTRDFILEAVIGLKTFASIPVLPSDMRSYVTQLGEDRLQRLNVVRDMLRSAAPEGMPSPETIAVLHSRLNEIEALIDDGALPSVIRAVLHRRLEALRIALRQAENFGSEIVLDAAGQLAATATAAHVQARAAPIPKKAKRTLKEVVQHTSAVMETAGHAAFLWERYSSDWLGLPSRQRPKRIGQAMQKDEDGQGPSEQGQSS